MTNDPIASSNRPCDFTGFTVPTTRNTPWGEPGAIVNISLVVDIETGKATSRRDLFEGVWDRSVHGLHFLTAGKKEATKGIFGLVSISVEPITRPVFGFAVFGRALLENESLLRVQLIRVAKAEIARHTVNLRRIDDEIETIITAS